MSFDNMSLGFGGTSRFSGQRGRTADGTNRSGVRYPSPFFDIAHTYLPPSMKALLRWCRYYYLVNPLINTVIHKMSEYPVTEIIIDEKDPKIREKWEAVLGQHLRYRAFQIEVGLDYYTYGICATTIHFPFTKYLICKKCGHKEKSTKIFYKWRNLEYIINCEKCGQSGGATVLDYYERDLRRIRLMRWNPEYINVDPGFGGADPIYTFELPLQLKNDLILGKKSVLDTVPDIFVEALKRNKYIRFADDNIFVFRRPIISQKDNGWGMPLIMPVLKDTFYLQVLRKAQEAIAQEHIVPLRVLFPQAGSSTSDPYCVSPETLIETLEGLKPASEVREGDYLRSHAGIWRPVEATKTRAIEPDEKVFNVKVASLSAFQFKVSEEHPIYAVRRTSKQKPRLGLADPDFIPIKDLKKGDYVAYPTKREVRRGQLLDLGDYLTERTVTDEYVYRTMGQEPAEIYEWMEETGYGENGREDRRSALDAHGWSEKNFEAARAAKNSGSVDRVSRYLPVNSDLATLIGFYLAEGSLNGKQVSFSLHLFEMAFAGRIHEAVKNLGFRGTSCHERPEQNGLSVQIEDVLLSELLSGLCGHGFLTKRIPDIISESEDRVLLPCLRAIFDGDGCSIDTETRRVGLKMSNPGIIAEVRRLLLSFGLIGCMVKETFKEGDLSVADAYQLNYNGKAGDALELLLKEHVYPDDIFQRVGFFRGDYVLLRIDDIDAVTDVPEVIGFQMAGDKSFCVVGVATHNTNIDLNAWKSRIEGEIAKWKYDNNYIPILPVPIGNETIGGDGKALGLYQEMDVWSKQIVAGMGVPQEFVYGGLQYSGSNVSMRMLENMFIGYRTDHENMLNNFVIRRIANFMQWPVVKAHMKRFKMADDLQRSAFYFQLNQAQKLSDQTLLNEVDQDPAVEDERKQLEMSRQVDIMRKQQLAQAGIQGEVMLVQGRYQAKAQEAMMESQAKLQEQQGGQMGGAGMLGPDQMAGNDAAGGTGGIPQGLLGGGQGGAQDGQGAPQTGQQGEMIPGQQADPAMPEGSTVSTENAQQAPTDGIPLTAASPLQMGQKGGGYNLLYLAKRAANSLKKLDPMQANMELNKMRMGNPQLANLVLQILQKERGSQKDPLNPMQSPQPQQKPTRRASSTGV